MPHVEKGNKYTRRSQHDCQVRGDKFQRKCWTRKPIDYLRTEQLRRKAAVKIIKNVIWQCFLADDYLNCARRSDAVLIRCGGANRGRLFKDVSPLPYNVVRGGSERRTGLGTGAGAGSGVTGVGVQVTGGVGGVGPRVIVRG